MTGGLRSCCDGVVRLYAALPEHLIAEGSHLPLYNQAEKFTGYNRMGAGEQSAASLEPEGVSPRPARDPPRRFLLVGGRLVARSGGAKNKHRFFINVEDIRDIAANLTPVKFQDAELSSAELVSGPPVVPCPAGDGRLEAIPYAGRTYAVRRAQHSLSIQASEDDFRGFNPMKLKNALLYTSSGLPVPRRGCWRRLSDCKVNGVCILRHFKIHFRRMVIRILMRNDTLLTHSDADCVYRALRKYFEVKDYEYFFNRYTTTDGTPE